MELNGFKNNRFSKTNDAAECSAAIEARYVGGQSLVATTPSFAPVFKKRAGLGM